MLGGMPVAVAAGLCLHRIRMESGLDPALPTRYIVMCCVRDLDPLEQELVDRSDIEMITVNDVRTISDNIHTQMVRLSDLTDKIYIHIDMDVLDPREVYGHGLTVPGGPTSEELAAVLTVINCKAILGARRERRAPGVSCELKSPRTLYSPSVPTPIE